MCHFESGELCLLLLGCYREGRDCRFFKKGARAIAGNSMQKNVLKKSPTSRNDAAMCPNGAYIPAQSSTQYSSRSTILYHTAQQ